MKKGIKLLIACMLLSSTSFAQVEDGVEEVVLQKKNRSTEYGRGISVDKAESTVPYAAATEEELSHKISINPSNMLYGLIPGLQVLQNANNAWNDGATLYIRGLGTTNSRSPLVLVDGFERSINTLSAEEIESVSILKDAVSTALYGVKGANGVVYVTTKRGLESKPVVDFSYNFNLGTPRRMPEFVDGYTYASALNEAMKYDGLTPRYTSTELDAFKNQTHPGFYSNVDWWDEVIRGHSYGDNATLSVRGGSNAVKYFTQINFLDDRGILRPTNDNDGYSTQFKYSKLNIRTNLDISIGNSTKVKLNLLGTFSEHNRPGTQTDDIFEALYKVPSGAFPVKTNKNMWGGTTVYSNNPVALVSAKGHARSQARTMLADIELLQDLGFLTKGLNFGIKIGLDNSSTYWDNNTKNFGYQSASINLETNEETYNTLRNEGTLAFSRSVGGNYSYFNLESRLNYETSKDKHKFNATLLYAMNKLNQLGRNTSRAFIDVVGYGHYAYNNRYLVDVSLSGSASSILAPGKRWGFFPALGAGWVLSEEDALKSNWLNFLKLRASYGISGRADFDPNLWYDLYSGGNNYYFKDNPTSQSGLRENQLGMKNLTYEKSHKLNVGIDLEIFNKLSVTLDGFYDHRTDILVSGQSAYSSVLGITVPQVNDGVVDSYGFEAALRWNDRIGNLSYMLGGQFSFARNEIKEMKEEFRPYDYLKRTGNRVGQIFGYEVIGIYQNQQEIDNRTVKQLLSEVRPGDLIFKDQNNDNVIDEYDMVPLGYSSISPEIYYSFDLGAEYKGIGVYAMFQGVGNYSKILNTAGLYRPLINNGTVSKHYYNNRWTENNPDAKYPRLTSTGSENNYSTNSLWVANASFLKLRTLELYYKLPAKTLNSLKGVSNAKIFARVHDLFSIDNIKVADPESIGATHPTMTQCTFGVNLSF